MEILLNTTLNSFVQLIGVLLIFVFVLVITYLTTKWMAGYQKAHTVNKNLQIIETIRVGNNKMISIIEAGTKYLVVSIGKDEVHLLTELSKEELKDFSFEKITNSSTTGESFQDLLGKMKNKFPKK